LTAVAADDLTFFLINILYALAKTPRTQGKKRRRMTITAGRSFMKHGITQVINRLDEEI